MPPPHILVLDPCPDHHRLLSSLFVHEPYRISEADSLTAALALLAHNIPQLVLLVAPPPGLSGERICRELRARIRAPLLVVTPQHDEAYAAALFDAGADDVVPTPAAPRAFAARIRAILRRCGQAGPPSALLAIGSLSLDRHHRTVSGPHGPIALQPIEWSVLEQLAEAGGTVVSRDRLIVGVWGTADPTRLASLHVAVNKLRRKLKQGGAGELIVTVPGVGYRLGPPRREPQSQASLTWHSQPGELLSSSNSVQ